MLTRRNTAEGVGATLPFAVLDRASGRQRGYVCLHEPAHGDPADVLCGFEVIRYRDARPGPWIAQGDVQRDEASGALVLSRLAVTATREEVGEAIEARDSAASVAAGLAMGGEAAALARIAQAWAEPGLWPEGQEPSCAGGVTAAVLRDVPLGWAHLALAEARQQREDSGLMRLREALQPVGTSWFGHAVADAADVPRKRPGRPPLSDEHLLHIAEAVLQEKGAPGVHQRVGQKLHMSASTVRDHVAACRRAGWLAPTSPGRRDAAPGPRLLTEWNKKGTR